MKLVRAASLALTLLIPATSLAGVELRQDADGRLALAAEAVGLQDVLAALGARAGFVADLAPEVRGLPVTTKLEGGGEEILSRLLRGTNHVLVRNEAGRVVRVMVVGLVDPDRAGPVAAAEMTESAAGSGHAAPSPIPDTIATERALILEGKAPDTGAPSGLSGALRAAAETAARERLENWARFAPVAKP